MAALNLAFWRKWHRWIGFPAVLFLLWAAATGVLVAFTEFFGEEEALREATRDLISPVTVSSAQTEWSEPIARAFATTATQSKGAPVDKLEVQFKGPRPTITSAPSTATYGSNITVQTPNAASIASVALLGWSTSLSLELPEEALLRCGEQVLGPQLVTAPDEDTLGVVAGARALAERPSLGGIG